MRISTTLSLYYGKLFLKNAVIVLAGLMALVYLGEFVELARRAASSDIGMMLILEMSLLKILSMVQKIVPFATLIGAIYTLYKLVRSSELVVTRASGVSVWQFLLPAFGGAIILATIVIGILSPVSASLLSRFETMEARLFKGASSLLAVSSGGLWLRQADSRGQTVIHALRVSDNGEKLYDVTLFSFKDGDVFYRRIDAPRADLKKGNWLLDAPVVVRLGSDPVKLKSLAVPTTLTVKEIQNSFSSPETLSFWELPRFISALEGAGFSATRHIIHLHSGLSLPVNLIAMVLIAATFCMRLSIRSGVTGMVIGGIVAGFLFYFVNDLMLALGQSGKIDPMLAAWIPGVTGLMIGAAMMFQLEDG